MKQTNSIVLGAVLFLGASVALACDYPERPTIPDGSTASRDDMMAAKASITTYLTGVDEYLVCLENEEKAAVARLENPATEELQRREDMLNKKFEAANEEKALVGEQFNVQVRAYNAARASQ